MEASEVYKLQVLQNKLFVSYENDANDPFKHFLLTSINITIIKVIDQLEKCSVHNDIFS